MTRPLKSIPLAANPCCNRSLKFGPVLGLGGKAALFRFALILVFVSAPIYTAEAFTPTADQRVCATLPANADVVAACNRIIEAPNSTSLDRAISYTFRADAAPLTAI